MPQKIPGSAPYPTGAPRETNPPVVVGGRADALRSRIAALREKRQLPSGVKGYTTSSLHPVAPHADPASGAPAINRGNGAGGTAHNRYVSNLKEQVAVLQSQLAMYRTGKPAVEGHECDPQAEMDREAHHRAQGVKDAEAQLRADALSAKELRQELQEAKDAIAAERRAALKARDDHHAYRKEQEGVVGAKAALERDAAQTAQRLELLENELEYVKRELAASRQKEADYLAHTTGIPTNVATGAVHGSGPVGADPCIPASNGAVVPISPDDAMGLANAAAARGIVPASVAQRIVADYQRLLAERNSFGAQVTELQRQNDERGMMMDDLTKTLAASQDETAKLVASIRHEQQRYQALIAASQTDRVQVEDHVRELAFLRLANKELCADKERLEMANRELYRRLRGMVDERAVSDLAVANTIEAARALQTDGERVQAALAEEQRINADLQERIAGADRDLLATRQQKSDIASQLEDARTRSGKLESQYVERVKQVEGALKTLQQSQATARASESQSLQSATTMLEELKAGMPGVVSPPPAAPAVSTAAPTPAAATATTAPAVAGAVPVSTPAASGSGGPSAPAPALKSPTAPLAAVVPAMTASSPSGSTTSSLLAAAREVMQREKRTREEAARAVASASTLLQRPTCGGQHEIRSGAASRTPSPACECPS